MNNSASLALIDSVVAPNATILALEMVEIALDSILKSGILKDIPFISWMVKSHAIITGIRDRTFLKKLGLFLMEASQLSEEERVKFEEKLQEDPEFAESTGENVLLLLDKFSEIEKARLMGYAFRRFVQGHIDSTILSRIYAGLEFMPYWQFCDLPMYYFERGLAAMGQGAVNSYLNLWLIEVYYGDKDSRLHFSEEGESGFISYHQPFYRKTPVGLTIARLIQEYLDEPNKLDPIQKTH